MALKTNSKKARENIRAYIMQAFNGSNYNIETPATFKETAVIIWDIFQKEKYYNMEYIRRNHLAMQDVFIEWCEGLPSILDTCYYYNVDAVELLGDILEQTPVERARYTQDDAEKMLSKLIYREIETGV